MAGCLRLVLKKAILERLADPLLDQRFRDFCFNPSKHPRCRKLLEIAARLV